MVTPETLMKIKQGLRLSHTKLDEDIMADIEACLADLEMGGIVKTDPKDPLIFNAVKLWCRSLYTDDTAKGSVYLERYNALKARLMNAEGYGWEAEADE